MAAQAAQISNQSEFNAKRDRLKDQLYALWRQSNRQQAGLDLEKILNDIFILFKLNPRAPFKVTGEQIDGSFELDNEIYLIEAKWVAEKISEAPLLEFRGKIEGKSTITRGVFLSMNGYTEPAMDSITRGKQPNFFLMDGYDLSLVLEGHIDLVQLLRTKVRLLAEEGMMFISAKECL